MSRRTAAVVAWTLVAVSTAAGFTGTGVTLAVDGFEGWHFVSNDGLAISIFLVAAVVGALVASRLPANPIGWIFIGLVVSLGFSGGAEGYVALSVDHGHLGGLVPWVAWYAEKVFLALFATLFLILLLFPNGRLLTRRWQVVLWTGTAGLLLSTVGVLLGPGMLEEYPQFRNPAGVDSPLIEWLFLPGFVLVCAALIGSVVSVVLRFRRARGVERQQLTLLMAAGVVGTTTLVVGGFVTGLSGSEDLGTAMTLLGFLAIPVAIGVAMLRYRLYEVDRLISRTLVYAALTVVLGAAYVGLVLAGQAVFSSFAGGSNLAIATSTLVVAGLFLPVRARIQRFVDRRFYRRRYNARRTIDDFAARLRQELDIDSLRQALVVVVDEAMQPATTALWLRRRD